MTLYVFALNTPVSVTVTDLTRARGEVAGLPPLADWLGLEDLDTDRIELFPVADLGELPLSSYVATAHDTEVRDEAPRLDALSGSVLLVPGRAMAGEPKPGPEATLIAALPTAQADHSGTLPPVEVATQQPEPEPAAADEPSPPAKGWIIGLALILAALLVWWLL